MPIFYLIEFRLAKGKKKGTTGVPSRFWGQKFLKTGFVPELRSIDPARTDVGREADRLMAAFGVGPMRTLETASGIRERLGVDLRLRIAAHG